MSQNGKVINAPPLQFQDFLGSEEAEMAVLGSILIDPSQYDHVSMHIDSMESFYFLKHGYIWDAMTRLVEKNEPIDMLTLAERLEQSGKLDDIGGRAYIVNLSNHMGTSIHAMVYAELVSRLCTRRRILQATERIKQLAYTTDIDLHDVQAQAEDLLLSSYSKSRNQFGGWSHEIISELYEDFEQMLMHPDSVPGIPTGLRDLDHLMLGFEAEQLSIWAGRPGMCKTSTFVSIVYNRCESGDMVLVFSSEMSRKQLTRRLWSMVSGVPLAKIKNPRLASPQERHRITQAISRVAEYKLFVDDTPEPKPSHVRAMTKIYKDRYDIQYILVDGIYKMKPNRKHETHNLDVGSISSDLREIARSFHIHVAATHQLSRAVDSRQDKRPVLSDLRDSGEIEQNADKVIFLYREEVYNEATEFPNVIDFIVAKHRDGQTGVVSAYFEKTLTRVMNASVHRVDLSDLE